MANKLNLEFLRGKSADVAGAADTQQNTKPDYDGIATKFKSNTDIFNRSEAAIDMIRCDRLLPYEKHPFAIRDGDRLNDLIESVTEQGVLVPLIVRVHKEQRGYYEILAGHHRQVAAQRVGLDEIPCIIKDVDDNTAALIVVESNKQRGFADMLPSEIAKALMLEYDALKCQGKRTDLLKQLDEILHEKNACKPNDDGVYPTSGTMCQKLNSDVETANKKTMSERNIRYYIRLNYLNEGLLSMVDSGDIALRPAVDISFLDENAQRWVSDTLEQSLHKLDMKKAQLLKEHSASGKLTESLTTLIIVGDFNKKPKAQKLTAIKLPVKKIKSYMPSELESTKYEEYIIKALEFYQLHIEEEEV